MRRRGTDSWRISIDDGCPQAFGIALFVRAAAGIAPQVEPPVPPLDEPVVATVSLHHDLEAATPQWASWWDALVDDEQGLPEMVPPRFTGLTGSPHLRDLVAELFEPAMMWTSGRRNAFIDDMRRRGHPGGIEGDVVREAEHGSGRNARPFRLRITVLPVAGLWWGQRDDQHLLVSEQLRAGEDAYRRVLRPLIDVLL